MLTLNKYLRELGYSEKIWPFNEIIENTRAFESGSNDYDGRYVEKAPLTDGTICEGFIDAESFSLDLTLAMIIYSYLCYFRENCMCAIPLCMMYKNGKELTTEQADARWHKLLDDMIIAFKYYIQKQNFNIDRSDYEADDKHDDKINKGMKLFIKYFGALWW